MTVLSDRYNQLQSNIRTGQNTAVSLSKAPIELNRDVGPLSHLNDDPFKFSSISYPRDVTQDMQNGHYMLFYINVQNKTKYNYTPADGGTGAQIGQNVEYRELVEGVHEGTQRAVYKTKFVPAGGTDASYREGQILKGVPGNVLGSDSVSLKKGRKAMSGFASVMPTTTRITDSIAIYLPPNVSTSTTAEYDGGVEMGIIGLAAAGASDFVTKLKQKDFVGALKGIGGSASGILQEIGMKAVSEVLAGASMLDVDSENVQQFANKAFGRATNPYMEVLFKNVGMRSFDYNFTFSPRNSDETLDVQKIIKMFRFHMLPELQGANKRYMTLPSTFDIHYMYQMSSEVANENQFYTKIATCVLNSVDVDYTPGGVKSFDSGAPTQITMKLSFMETEMLTKQHVDKGF